MCLRPTWSAFASLILHICRWFHRGIDGEDFVLLDFRDGWCDPRLVFIQVGVSVDAHTFLLSHIVYLKRVLQSFDKALT